MTDDNRINEPAAWAQALNRHLLGMLLLMRTLRRIVRCLAYMTLTVTGVAHWLVSPDSRSLAGLMHMLSS